MPYDEDGYWYDEEPEAPPERIELSAHIRVQNVSVPGFPQGTIIWDGEGPAVPLENMTFNQAAGVMLIAELAVLAVAGATRIYDNCGAQGLVDIAAYVASNNYAMAASTGGICLRGFGVEDYE